MFVEINGHNIYYEIHGDGIPVMTIHGFSVDHRLMKGFIEKFIPKEKYKRVYFDLPGMGRTEKGKQLNKAEEMYEIIKCFIKKTIGSENYIIIGQSYGGYLMRKLIKDEPDKILGAMFVCPVIYGKSEKRNIPKQEIIYSEINDKDIMETEVYKNFIDAATFIKTDIFNNFKENVYPALKIADEKFLSHYY